MTVETGLPDKVVEALKRGNKIEAIKLLREQTGVGLKEAKEAVDASGIEGPAESPGAITRAKVPWAIIAVVVALLLYTYLRR